MKNSTQFTVAERNQIYAVKQVEQQKSAIALQFGRHKGLYGSAHRPDACWNHFDVY